MGKLLLTFLTAAVGVAAAIFVTLLAVCLTQQTLGPSLKPWLIGSGSVVALLLLCILIGVGIETRRRWVTRELARLLNEGETLNEVALRIPPGDRDRAWPSGANINIGRIGVLQNLGDGDRDDFQALDLEQAPNSSDFEPLTKDQSYEVASRVAVLRTIVNRLRGS